MGHVKYNIFFCLYAASCVYYSLIAVDVGSRLYLAFCLTFLSSVFSNKSKSCLYALNLILMHIEIILKIYVFLEEEQSLLDQYLDVQCLQNWRNMAAQPKCLAFVSIYVLSWALIISFSSEQFQSLKEEKQSNYFNQFIDDIISYVLPFCLYALTLTKAESLSDEDLIFPFSLLEVEYLQKVIFAALTALYLLSKEKSKITIKFINLVLILLMVWDQTKCPFGNRQNLYRLDERIILGLKICLLVFFRVHNKCFEQKEIIKELSKKEEKSSKDDESNPSSKNRISSFKKLTLKRRNTLKGEQEQMRVIVILVLSIATLILTNALGNILGIICIVCHIPSYQEARFKFWFGISLLVSMALQPSQFIYFPCFYLLSKIEGADLELNKQSWWSLVQLVRMIQLFSRVSVLNLLMGIFSSFYLVVLTLIFRNLCSYFQVISVFMGTEDNYLFYANGLIPSSVVSDSLLWVYLICLKLYSPTSSIKFEGTDIVDIFAEYPLIKKMEKILKILKIFHWIAYLAIGLIILRSQPSLFTLCRMAPLIFIIFFSMASSDKTSLHLRLWWWNLYTTFSIAFVKYFYLLTQYDNLSPWLIYLLDPLRNHWKLIGLNAPDKASLVITFSSDVLLIVLNLIVLFIVRVDIQEKTYLQYEKIIIKDKFAPLLADHSIKEEPSERDDKKDLHYLYRMYAKPFQFQFYPTSPFLPLLTDYLLDLAFLSFLLISYFGQDSTHFYFAFFIWFLVGFVKQRGKAMWRYFYFGLVGLSVLDILYLYGLYVYSVVKDTSIQYNLLIMGQKFIVLVAVCTSYQINQSLHQYYQEMKQSFGHQEKNHQKYWLCRFILNNITDDLFRKQMLCFLMALCQNLTLSLFLACTFAFDSQEIILPIIHFIAILVLCAINWLPCFRSKQNQTFQIYWVYPIIFCAIFDLYNKFLLSFVYLLFARFYEQIQQEFNLFVKHLVYESKSSNQSIKKRVQKVEGKFQHQEKLQSIKEARETIEKQNALSQPLNWKYKNWYLTMIWLQPIACLLISLLGVVLFEANVVTPFLLTLGLLNILVCLSKLFETLHPPTYTKVSFLLTLILTMLGSFHLIYQIYFLQLSDQILLMSRCGLFLIIFGYLQFSSLFPLRQRQSWESCEHSDDLHFIERRFKEGRDYWKTKCELVSDLGSQIHNEKKISSLKKYYLNKENISTKVKYLTEQLKSKQYHKHKLENLMDLQNVDEFKNEEFEVYSNMLTFMSIQDLQFCYIKLNLYYRQHSNSIHTDITTQMKHIRKWVLSNYHGSISKTINEYYLSAPFPSSLISSRFTSKLSQVHNQNQNYEKSQLHSLPLNCDKLDQSLQQQNLEHSQGLSSSDEQLDFEKRYEISKNQEAWGQRIDERLNELSWIGRKVTQNVEIIGLIIVVGWNFFGGVYTIPANIVIFSWAIVLETKTTVTFWTFLMVYCGVILVLKMVVVDVDCWVLKFVLYYNSESYIYEFIIMGVGAMEILFLKLGGTASVAYSQRENIFDAFFRTVLNQSSQRIIHPMEKKFIQVYKQLSQPKHSFFYRVFSKSRLKPGKDLYPQLAIIELIIFLYIFFFYDMMEFQSKNNRKSFNQILIVSQFSKNMIFALFFQMIVMIADRLIVSLNFVDPYNQSLENFFLNFTFKEEIKYFPPDDVKKMPLFDSLLILKYLFHTALLICVNFFVYVYIPSSGLEKSLIPDCHNNECGTSSTYLSIFLLLYLVYFVISGLQIKHGFNKNKCRNTLMEKHHWVDYYIYVFFTGIPFLWEFKKICDWTTTSTALPLFHWMKFQDINARLYQSKCEAEILKIKPRAKAPWNKLIVGPPSCLFILCLIFSPILIYSSLNPFAVKDQIISSSIHLSLVMDDKIQYKFFQTSHTSQISQIDVLHQAENITNEAPQHLDINLKFFEKFNWNKENLYLLKMSSFPDQDFMLSEPAVEQLARRLKKTYESKINQTFKLTLGIIIIEKEGGESQIVLAEKLLTQDELKSVFNLITLQTNQLTISEFYSPYPGELDKKMIFLSTNNQGQYFELLTDGSTGKDGIYFYYKSEVKYKTGVGVIAFYLTYVVLMNSLFRFYITGGLDNIIFEGCELEKILVVCDAVRSARILENFYQEEYLYFSLMDLMRYPRMLKTLTNDFTNLRNQVKVE